MNKKALVTGASEGIGYVLAKRLANDGYAITAVARNESHLQRLVSEIGPEHSYLVADLLTEAGQNVVIKAVADKHFDLFVNNAGIAALGKFTEISVERHVNVLRLNCEAVVRLAHAYLKSAKDGDALINVSSALAFMPMPALGVYSATKAFVTSFSESLWYEQRQRGVYVMGLCPGMTSTNFGKNNGANDLAAPSFMTQTPEELVENALCALKARKKPTVISGLVNKIFTFVARLRTRKGVVATMGGRG
ncbi:MAG: SDR family NAD(P)-dependent oxidoreductase [Nitrospinae bacterium]|nr:SDR family NAD(P)-dependent oxidoreductase [Nitrospinota bacterium]